MKELMITDENMLSLYISTSSVDHYEFLLSYNFCAGWQDIQIYFPSFNCF